MIDHRHRAGGNLTDRRIDFELIADMIAKGSRVLEIGCSKGELLELIVKRRKGDVHGLELSQAGVNDCVARGLAVVQGDADTDLHYYPDNGFDTVILSQTLQATQRPLDVLCEMARIGKQLIVSIPNFGHWRLRAELAFNGRMPETNLLSAHWYNTANIHLCTLTDFVELCPKANLKVEKTITLRGNRPRQIKGAPNRWHNLTAELAVFVLVRG